MKRQNIGLPIMAVGFALTSVFSVLTLGASVASADDDYGQQPAWSYRCDRNWNPLYCLPNSGNTRDRWNNRIWRKSQDSRRTQDWRRAQDWCNNQDWRNNRDWNNQDWRRAQDWCNSQDWRDNPDWQQSDRQRQLLTGTAIPTSIDNRRQIVLRRGARDRASLTLIVNRDVENRWGRVVIPRDSRIEGELIYRDGGYRFESDRIRFPNGRSEDISAISRTIDSNDDYYDRSRRRTNVSNAAILIISSILSGSSNSNVLDNVFDPRDSGSRRGEIFIYPDQDLNLRLTRDFSRD
jgi:hypothetical protein